MFKNKEKLFAEALKEAKLFLEGNKQSIPVKSHTKPVTPKPNIAKQPHNVPPTKSISSVTERWEERKTVNVNKNIINKLIDSDILIVGKNDKNLEHICYSGKDIYCITGDYAIAKPSGAGCYVADIHQPKYCTNLQQSKVMLYFNNLTHKWKKAQREWILGDIRAYQQIDFEVYKHYYDPASGRVPGVVSALCAKIRSAEPHRQITLYNIDTSRLSAYDQVLLRQFNVHYI